MNIGLVTLQVIVLISMLIGLFGLLIPLFPGLVVIWVAALIYGLITGIHGVIWVFFIFITVLMLFGNVIDNVMMGAGAKQTGASWLSIGVALVAGVAGTLLFPPIGGIIAALIGVFLVELIRVRELKKAAESLWGMVQGFGWSFFVRFIIGAIMIAWWVAWAFFLPTIQNWLA